VKASNLKWRGAASMIQQHMHWTFNIHESRLCLMFFSSPVPYNTDAGALDRSHRADKGRKETEGVYLLFQLECTPQLGSLWLHRVHLLLYPSKIFSHGNKNTLCLALVYSVLLMYLKLWHKISCQTMAFFCSPCHRGLRIVLTWLGIGD
jgi:hypothetical protein